MTDDAEGQPLAGLKGLELGSSLAGPFAARTLADLGAEVIKVEPPEVGDPARGWGSETLGGVSPAFQSFNRNKRSITADFTSGEDIAALQALMADGIDVVLQNLRPGVADRFGIGAEWATAHNPRLIYCNIGAFGGYGPMQTLPGYDPLMQGFSGIAAATGDENSGPVRVGVPIIDIGTGMWATIGILAALQRRERTGRGGVVDTSLLETAMAWQTLNFAIYEASGETPRRMGLRGPVIVPNAGYDTADGKLMIVVGTDRQFRAFCNAIGRPELADDERFARNDGRWTHEPVLNAEITDTLMTAPRAHWAAKLDAAGVPNAPIQDVGEASRHPQVEAGGQLQASPDGGFRLIGPPLRFDGVRPPFRQPAPQLGEATRQVFSRLHERSGT